MKTPSLHRQGELSSNLTQDRVGKRASISLSPSGAKATIATLRVLNLLKVQEIYI